MLTSQDFNRTSGLWVGDFLDPRRPPAETARRKSEDSAGSDGSSHPGGNAAVSSIILKDSPSRLCVRVVPIVTWHLYSTPGSVERSSFSLGRKRKGPPLAAYYSRLSFLLSYSCSSKLLLCKTHELGFCEFVVRICRT